LILQIFTGNKEISPGFGSILALMSSPGQNRTGGDSMRFRTSLCLATLFLVFFTIAAWSTPLPLRPAADSFEPTPDNQSLSGKIASIGDAEFTVQVMKNQDVKTVQFQVDDKTRVEGKLTVGAQAAVEYRSDAGKNVAVRVIVSPASGMNLF
jgi:hypothetical protein